MENVSPTTSTTPRLYRSATDKVVAGVCGGLASYFKIDPVIVRLAFVVFALVGGASVLLYIVLWIAVPIGETSTAPALGCRRGGPKSGSSSPSSSRRWSSSAPPRLKKAGPRPGASSP